MLRELTLHQRAALREALETTDTYRTLADAIGISVETIHRMVVGPPRGQYRARTVRKVHEWQKRISRA